MLSDLQYIVLTYISWIDLGLDIFLNFVNYNELL